VSCVSWSARLSQSSRSIRLVAPRIDGIRRARRLADDALHGEISSAHYFAAVAWGKAKSATRERAEAKRHLAGPLTQGWIGYYQLRRTSLADEIRMYLSARALYRARRAAAEAELARRRAQNRLAA
jgi:hypothetical protein